METLHQALQHAESSLFSVEEGNTAEISPECRQRVADHLQRLNDLVAQTLRRVAELEAEAKHLASLPPPPPIGAEELAEKQGAIVWEFVTSGSVVLATPCGV